MQVLVQNKMYVVSSHDELVVAVQEVAVANLLDVTDNAMMMENFVWHTPMGVEVVYPAVVTLIYHEDSPAIEIVHAHIHSFQQVFMP